VRGGPRTPLSQHDLSNLVEIPGSAILHRLALRQNRTHGGITLWVRKDAKLVYKMAPGAQALAHYFAGQIRRRGGGRRSPAHAPGGQPGFGAGPQGPIALGNSHSSEAAFNVVGPLLAMHVCRVDAPQGPVSAWQQPVHQELHSMWPDSLLQCTFSAADVPRDRSIHWHSQFIRSCVDIFCIRTHLICTM